EAVVDFETTIETSCDCRHYPIPVHCYPHMTDVSSPFGWCDSDVRFLSFTGRTGGRTESGVHPRRNWVAGPQIRPWHGPIPQRDCSFAARQEPCGCSWLSVTSSQRQTMVSGAARRLSSGRS